ncbi:MAG: 30S ribosomal protein S18 [Deltaproteobacteria bacterium]|nr:30S ribosomal protein S18 [Deltaproteobacteria bacterium]
MVRGERGERSDRGERGERGDRGERGENGRSAEGYGGQRRMFHRRKTCRYCGDAKLRIDYKDAKALRPFISERGKILPRRMSGACAKHQREISTAIKRARTLAIIPFTATSIESGS